MLELKQRLTAGQYSLDPMDPHLMDPSSQFSIGIPATCKLGSQYSKKLLTWLAGSR